MSETHNTLPVEVSSNDAAPTDVTSNKPPGHLRHYYRIGIVGSKSSGKTCLLAALGMARNPNTLGYTAIKTPLEDGNNIELIHGNEWINDAIVALENGKWPPPNPHERVKVRFRFTDGRTRQKDIEIIDYSGELLDPEVARDEMAKRLRELLREMDGLIVLAEHPLLGQDISKVENALNGLLGVFTLLNVGRQQDPNTVARQTPIAMIVNKWDRSPHFVASTAGESETRAMLEKFLTSEPLPFHASVEKALRPAAGGRFKSFAVSAVGGVRCEGTGELTHELPPAKGTLMSVGVEEPFLWVIQERDEIDIAEQEQSLARRSNLFCPPWPRWLRHHDYGTLRLRFDIATPEATRLASVQHRSWILAVRQFLIYALVLLAWEGVRDGRNRRNAEECIKNPAQESGWQTGTAWLIAYGRSNPLRHVLYSRVFLPKQSALDRAIQVATEKDMESFDRIPKLSQDGDPVEEDRLADAERMARNQMVLFPNSPRNPAREEVIAKTQHIRDDLEFEKNLGGWRQRLDSLRPTAYGELQNKLKGLSTLVTEVRDTKAVPLLDGPLRNKWKILLNDTDSVRKELADKIEAKTLAEEIERAMAADDFLQASNLLAGTEFQKNPDQQLLDKFQLMLGKRVEEKAETLSKQGENWEAAVQYAEKFLEPVRRSVVTDALYASIQATVDKAKAQGDEYLYELARKNENNDTLDHYQQKAPLKSMASEVANFRKWLEERNVPRTLTFRVVEIIWDANQKKGFSGNTAIKLYVNDVCDPLNEEKTDNSRTGTTSDSGGVRAVSVPNLAQRDTVKIAFQSWHIGTFGGWEQRSSVTKHWSPEDLFDQLQVQDSTGNLIRIAVDEVLPKPFLPDWHPPQ